MNKPIIFTLLLAILFLMPTLGAKAQTKEPYVALKDGTATFYYNSSKPNGALAIQSRWDDANWPDDTRNSVTKVVFDNSFKDYEPTSCAYWFYEFENLTEISGIKENLNTANVTSMCRMFYKCSRLTTLDVSNFNTANVTDMGSMFYWCSSLTTLDLSNFNTANVTAMSSMFSRCSSLTTLDLSNFNTANVTTMESMFSACSSLTTLDVSNFNTANVKKMNWMFYYCSSLTTLDLSNFNTANVTSMYHMFCSCSSLTTLDVSNFNTANVTDMRAMFNGCSRLTTLDVSNFNTANVTNMRSMFFGCSSLTTLDVSNFNTANVTDMCDMFYNCRSLITLDLSNFNTANVTNMSDMFEGCSSLNAIFVGDNWSTASVTKSSDMFDDCTKLCGGKGTGYNADITDATYAKIDGGKDAPGYFTKSGEPAFKIVIVSIEIATAPKTEYTEGEDFSAADGILSLVYNTGFKESIDLSKATITGYDKNKVGEQTLKIAYEGFETELKVTVKANQPTPVSSVADSPSIKVWSFNNTIYIETLPDSQYKIIDLQGRAIKSATTKSSYEEVNINNSGIYVVIINGKSYKVSL